MSLTFKLKYNEQANHALSAAFIRGDAPAIWLRTISNWNLAPAGLICFMLSQNNRPTDAAGLLVVFKPGRLPNQSQVQHPYTCIGGKLFIPIDAELTPPVSAKELPSLLIWDYQVFHPTYGFIGFEKADRITLADLLKLKAPVLESWNYAHPGQAGWVPLQQISVEPVELETLFDSVKDEVGSQSLDEIKKENLSTLLKLLGPLGMAGLKGALFLAKGMMSGKGNSNQQPGLLDRLTAWMEQKLEDLEKQRDSELKRLSDLFDKNIDEALKYAIPLDSKYFNRGTQKPSNKLGKRSTSFNLNKLGGGQTSNPWNVDNYYNDLRSKYLHAASKAIEENDHKKAAYIYAHLLADYHSAARVLKEGKHYREAAILYKDHLNNIPDAAVCLEEGGLMLEAIDLYRSIDRHEKAGDLYSFIGQQEQANQCYEHCVQKAMDNRDYLEVSRLTADRLKDNARAKKALINGWNDVKQPEACLTRYFNIVADENQQPLHQHLQQFYHQKEFLLKETSFLHVLDTINKKHPSAELQNTCRTISYELISDQVEKGDTRSLHLLKDFVPDDRLLLADCHRYIHTNPVQPITPFRELQLTTQPTWYKPMAWRNEILFLGIIPNGVSLARIAQSGQVEYHSWNIEGNAKINLWVSDDRSSDRIIVQSPPHVFLSSKLLPANNHFSQTVHIESPSWLPNDLIGMCLLKDTLVTLHSEHSGTFLNYYNREGTLEKSFKFHETANAKDRLPPPSLAEEMFYDNGYFYVPYKNRLLKISERGHAKIEMLTENVVELEVFKDNYIQFVVRTIDGCQSGYVNANEIVMRDDHFASGMNTLSIKFISERRFAVICSKKIHIYHVTKNERISLLDDIVTGLSIKSVFPAFTRNQLGMLDFNGNITIHDLTPL